MSVSVKLILTLVIGYLLGSISTGVIVSRVFGHKDIRSEGSGNSGTTNMLRVMGKKYALLTFAGDLLKGIVAVLIGKAWLGTQAGEIVGAFGAILGHNFPLYFGFKGGKGIATSFGCLLIVFPVQTLCAFGVFLLIVALTRYVSAGSLGAAVTLVTGRGESFSAQKRPARPPPNGSARAGRRWSSRRRSSPRAMSSASVMTAGSACWVISTPR